MCAMPRLQVCRLKFGSWTYDKAQVDLLNKTGEVELSAYVTNGEWMLTRYRIVRNEVVYPISPAIYPDVTGVSHLYNIRYSYQRRKYIH